MKVSKAKAAAALDAILANVNEAGGSNTPGTMELWSGTVPADCAASPGGTLLASCPLVDGSVAAFGATDTTTLIATGYTTGGRFARDTSADASGTVAYWRLKDYTGAVRGQGSVGTSGAELNLNTLTCTAGVDVTISSFDPVATALV